MEQELSDDEPIDFTPTIEGWNYPVRTMVQHQAARGVRLLRSGYRYRSIEMQDGWRPEVYLGDIQIVELGR